MENKKTKISPRDYDIQLRIVLVGNSNVGKSCIAQRFTKGEYNHEKKVTIAVDYTKKIVELDGTKIMINLYDTAGSEQYNSITSSYYKHADGIILVYDLTDSQSLTDLQLKWIPQVKNQCQNDIQAIMVGNKSDLDTREVTQQQAKELSETIPCESLEASATTDYNMDKLFNSIIKQVYQKKSDEIQKYREQKRIDLLKNQNKNRQQEQNKDQSSSCC